MRNPWGLHADGKPAMVTRRRSPRKQGHARTEGKGRTNPALDDA